MLKTAQLCCSSLEIVSGRKSGTPNILESVMECRYVLKKMVKKIVVKFPDLSQLTKISQL